jgi:hypothetical protein
MLCYFIQSYTVRSDRCRTRKYISEGKENNITQLSEVQDRTHHNTEIKPNLAAPNQDNSGLVSKNNTPQKHGVKSI